MRCLIRFFLSGLDQSRGDDFDVVVQVLFEEESSCIGGHAVRMMFVVGYLLLFFLCPLVLWGFLVHSLWKRVSWLGLLLFGGWSWG